MVTSEEFFPNWPLRDRILELMKSTEEFGGPQSVDDLCKNLGISNGSSRSVLVKLHKAGDVERIGKGIYRLKKDERGFVKDKPHLQ